MVIEVHSRAKVKLRRLYLKDGGGRYTEELIVKPYNRDKVTERSEIKDG